MQQVIKAEGLEPLMDRFEAVFVASIHKVWTGDMGPTGPFQIPIKEQAAAQRIPLSSFLETSYRDLLKSELRDEYLAGRVCGLPGCTRVDSLKRCAACGIVAY